jgi:outer membrane protein OmpA-like peptidoglycan-associated protein
LQLDHTMRLATSKLIVSALVGLLATPLVHGQAPIFRVTVVGRDFVAINYRQRRGDTKIDLAGTPLLAQARGVAKVTNEHGHLMIDGSFEGLQPATHFGAEYLTYVMWAITPEGRASNLGEVQTRGRTARAEATTDLQSFALVLTAEPYFAVTQPSELVVMENVVGSHSNGSIETVEARYELLTRGAYVGDRRTAFTARPPAAGVPLDVAQARNAVVLAQLAGADRYAAEPFTKAVRLMNAAEDALQRRQSAPTVLTSARQAVQTAEDARLISLKRQQEARVARERVEGERSRQDAADARSDADRARADADAARGAAEATKEAANAEVWQTKLELLKAQAAVAVAEQEKNLLRERLRDQLNVFLATRESAKGLIMDVPDVLFDSGRAQLTSVAREKLARVSGILAAQPGLHIEVQGHTDSVGAPEDNQRLSEQRAESVLAYLVQQQIPLTTIDIGGFGETRPAAPNDNTAGRQRNRRVELVVTGESIGTASQESPQ